MLFFIGVLTIFYGLGIWLTLSKVTADEGYSYNIYTAIAFAPVVIVGMYLVTSMYFLGIMPHGFKPETVITGASPLSEVFFMSMLFIPVISFFMGALGWVFIGGGCLVLYGVLYLIIIPMRILFKVCIWSIIPTSIKAYIKHFIPKSTSARAILKASLAYIKELGHKYQTWRLS